MGCLENKRWVLFGTFETHQNTENGKKKKGVYACRRETKRMDLLATPANIRKTR